MHIIGLSLSEVQVIYNMDCIILCNLYSSKHYWQIKMDYTLICPLPCSLPLHFIQVGQNMKVMKNLQIFNLFSFQRRSK